MTSFKYALGVLAILVAGTAQAQDVTFKGQDVTVSVGVGPGGGYDTYARHFARHLGKHLPGNPNVIVKNEPGAGSLKLAVRMFNAARKDGTELALIPSSVALEPLFGNSDAAFDTNKMIWIGNLDSDVSSCGVWKHANVKSWEDLKTREIIFGATGPSAITSIHPNVMASLVGLKIKVISGYAGTRDINVAMQRGEVDATCGMYMSTIRSQYQQNVDQGELSILMTFGKERTKDFPNVASLFELVKPGEDRQLAELIFGADAIGRPIAAPPGLKPELVTVLRKAFDATIADPDYLAEAKKIGLSVVSMNGADLQKKFAEFYETPKAVVTKAQAVMGRSTKR
jgi:tripartite-type tricarboxylate transporter receptor subunit TctC